MHAGHCTMSEIMVDRPAICKLTVSDSNLLVQWGKSRLIYEDFTERLNDAFAQHATNAAEFTLLGPEIRYHLQFSLPEDMQATLRRSAAVRDIPLAQRSPADRGLSVGRKRILARIYSLYQKLKRELFPELVSKLKEPPVADDYLDTDEDEGEEKHTEASDGVEHLIRGIAGTKLPATPPPEISPLNSQADTIPSAAHSQMEIDTISTDIIVDRVSTASFCAPLLELFNVVAMSITNNLTVYHDVDDVISNYLRRFNLTFVSSASPISDEKSTNIIISIPSKNFVSILCDSILSGRAFLLYLPLSIITDIDVSLIKCSLIITGDSARFLYHNKSKGGEYKYKQL